nr:DUF4328 domain-containing protein [Mycobacterium avium]
MAPLPDAPPAGPARAAGWQRTPPRLPPGYRWIAVRPGARAAAAARPSSPRAHPRYAVIPRWGLADRVEPPPAVAAASAHPGPPAQLVRTTSFVGVLVLGIAALVYVVRYLLLVINRDTLLYSWVAIGADWLGVLASVGAVGAVIASGVALIRWMIARRAAVFAHHGLPDPRSARALWAGCVVPLANLLWAPVFVIELALLEEHYHRLKGPILQWWITWVCSYAVSVSAIATSFVTDAQGIANNTILMVFGYLFAAATLAAATRIFEGFQRKPVARPAHRWVMVPDDGPPPPAPGAPVEFKGQEPAA